jgi:hypothetical protein
MAAQQPLSDLIRAHLTLRGWPFAEAPMRPYGKLAVTGLIGVIHRGFEADWQRANPKGHQFLFAMSSHTSNFRRLNGLSLIDPEPAALRCEVESYCQAVASILADMPQSEEQLLAAFTANQLGPHPISAYAGYVQRAKHAEFTAFMEKLASSRGWHGTCSG